MTHSTWRRWLMVSVCGAFPMLGCSHAEHQCDCYSATGPTVYIRPAPQPTMTVAAKPVEMTKVETTSIKEETPTVPVAAKKPEPPPGTIAVPLVAGGEHGSKTGTLELSNADAEAMGVRPGYTPGALFMPPK